MISPGSVTNGIEETDLHCTPRSGVSSPVSLRTIERGGGTRQRVDDVSAIESEQSCPMAYPERIAWEAYLTLVGRGGRPTPSGESIERSVGTSEAVSTGSSIEMCV